MKLKSMLLALSVVGMTSAFAGEDEVNILPVPESEVVVTETPEAKPADAAPAESPAADEKPACGCPH